MPSTEPLGFTIDDILPHGLFILAGSPKVGKSWLALDMCKCVTAGSIFWHYSTLQGDVLYLALENNHKRLQDRLSKVLLGCNLGSSTDIHFATQASKLGSGLSEQITAFLDAHPQTKLIVIDTMQYVRNTGKFTGTYSGDYADMDALREIIAGRRLTLLLITHTRKNGDADSLNIISGSTGLTGAVDGVFVLEKNKRTGSIATLIIANRDTESHQFDLQFDSTSYRWQFLGEHSDADDRDEEGELFEMLLLLLDEDTPTWKGTATQLYTEITLRDPMFNMPSTTMSKTLRYRQELLKSQYGIICTFTRNKLARLIELSRVADENIIVLPESAYSVSVV